MADAKGTAGGSKGQKREMFASHERPQPGTLGTACEGDQRDKAGADAVELEIRNAPSHSNVMACFRQDLPSVEAQLSVAKRRKREAEHHRTQQVSTSVSAKHLKAEERHRQHVMEEKKNSEREVAKEASKRDAVLERKRRQEEEMKQRRLAEFEKSERQRLAASERCAKLKKSSKSSLTKPTSQSSPTKPRLSMPAFDASSSHPSSTAHKASNSHQAPVGQKGLTVHDRLFQSKSTGSLRTVAKEPAAPAVTSTQKATVEAKRKSEAATTGKKKQQSPLKDIPSLPMHRGQQMPDKQKTKNAAPASLKASAPTESTVTCSSSRPAKVAPAQSTKEKQKSGLKAASATATAEQKLKLHQYLSPTDPGVHPPSRGAKAGKEQKSGEKVHANPPCVSGSPGSGHTSAFPLATALQVSKESEDDAEEGELVHEAAEKSPRTSYDSGLGQRSSCEESKQAHDQPICDSGSDYDSDDGQPQGKDSTKHVAGPLSPSQSLTHITDTPSVVIHPVEDSQIITQQRGLKHTSRENNLLNDDIQPTELATELRRNSDTPPRKKGIANMTPPSICNLERHGSLPPFFPSNFQANFLQSKGSDSDDDQKELQSDSENNDGGDLHSFSKPTKTPDRAARRLIVDQIMKETRAEREEIELKLAQMKEARTEKELERKPMNTVAPHAMLRVPSAPEVCRPSSEEGSDGEQVEEEEEEKEQKAYERERKLSAPALMMKRESVDFQMPVPYSGPLEKLPSFSSEESLNMEEKDVSQKGIYLRMPAYHPNHPPFRATDLTPLQESVPNDNAFYDCVSSEDDDDMSRSPVSEGFCGPMMDEVISDDDGSSRMNDEEFHKVFQVPADDIIESDSEDENSRGGVLPSGVCDPPMHQGEWVDEVESSGDEAMDIVMGESGHNVEEDEAELSLPQADHSQDKVESSTFRNVDVVSSDSESEGEGTKQKLASLGADCLDNVSSESDSEGQHWNGGAMCSEDRSASLHAHKMRYLVKKDSMLLYSKLAPASQKSFESCPLDDEVVSCSSDEEERMGEGDRGFKRTGIALPPPPLKGILKNRQRTVHTSHPKKVVVENSDEEKFEIEQLSSEQSGSEIQFHHVRPMAPLHHHRLDQVREEGSEGNEEDSEGIEGTALENVGKHSSADSKLMPDDCISDSETETMPNGSGNETPEHVSTHPGSHTEIQSKLEEYGNGFQSLTRKGYFADEVDSFSSDSDVDTEPLSVYGV